MAFGCNSQIDFCHFFHSLNLVIFGLNAFRHWVSCERYFTYSFSRINVVEAFNSTSRYLDDLLNIHNFFFEQMVG